MCWRCLATQGKFKQSGMQLADVLMMFCFLLNMCLCFDYSSKIIQLVHSPDDPAVPGLCFTRIFVIPVSQRRFRSYLWSVKRQNTLDLTGGSERRLTCPLSGSNGAACQTLTLRQRDGWDKNKYEPCELCLPFAFVLASPSMCFISILEYFAYSLLHLALS